MKPYFRSRGVTLYHGDCLDILRGLPDDCASAVITDPPYSSGGRTSGERARDPISKYVQHGTRVVRPSFSGDNRDGRSWAFWCTLWLSECLRITRDSCYALVFSDWRQLPSATDALQAGGWVWRGVIPWDKGAGARAPHTGYFRHQAEYVVWGTRGTPNHENAGGPWPGVYNFPVLQRDKFHITGKPTNLMRRLVQCAPRGSLIVDPFCGSGTTAVACVAEERQCIGIEREEANCEIAAKRLEGAQRG